MSKEDWGGIISIILAAFAVWALFAYFQARDQAMLDAYVEAWQADLDRQFENAPEQTNGPGMYFYGNGAGKGLILEGPPCDWHPPLIWKGRDDE